jgi:hypothetical protein
MTAAPHPRKCFSLTCPNMAEPGHWECDQCRARIHAASEAATAATARRKRARELAATVPHTKVASDMATGPWKRTLCEAFHPPFAQARHTLFVT